MRQLWTRECKTSCGSHPATTLSRPTAQSWRSAQTDRGTRCQMMAGLIILLWKIQLGIEVNDLTSTFSNPKMPKTSTITGAKGGTRDRRMCTWWKIWIRKREAHWPPWSQLLLRKTLSKMCPSSQILIFQGIMKSTTKPSSATTTFPNSSKKTSSPPKNPKAARTVKHIWCSCGIGMFSIKWEIGHASDFWLLLEFSRIWISLKE